MPLPVTTKQRMPGQQGSPFGAPREVPRDYVLPHGMWQVECSNLASVELQVFREFDDHGRPIDRESNERTTVTLIKQGGAAFCFSDGWNVSIKGGTAWVVQVLGT